MKAEIKKTIRLLDENLLNPLRKLWLAAETEADKEAWRLRIDRALDTRIRLMHQRDNWKGSA